MIATVRRGRAVYILLLIPRSVCTAYKKHLFPSFVGGQGGAVQPAPAPVSVHQGGGALIYKLGFEVASTPGPVFLLYQRGKVVEGTMSKWVGEGCCHLSKRLLATPGTVG